MGAASEIVRGALYQGNYKSPRVFHPKVDLHFACAKERRPRQDSAHRVIFFPLDDDPNVDWLSITPWCLQVDKAARICANEILHGGTVLTTCNMGLNRSGIVSALTLCRLGFDPEDAIIMVREGRGPVPGRDHKGNPITMHALCNPRFVEVIFGIG